MRCRERRIIPAVEFEQAIGGGDPDIAARINKNVAYITPGERRAVIRAAFGHAPYAVRRAEPHDAARVFGDGAHVFARHFVIRRGGGGRRFEVCAVEARDTFICAEPHPAVAVLKDRLHIFRWQVRQAVARDGFFIDRDDRRGLKLNHQIGGDAGRDEDIIAVFFVTARGRGDLISAGREPAEISVAAFVARLAFSKRAHCAALSGVERHGDAAQRLAADINHGDVQRGWRQWNGRIDGLGGLVDGNVAYRFAKARGFSGQAISARLEAAKLEAPVGLCQFRR